MLGTKTIKTITRFIPLQRRPRGESGSRMKSVAKNSLWAIAAIAVAGGIVAKATGDGSDVEGGRAVKAFEEPVYAASLEQGRQALIQQRAGVVSRNLCIVMPTDEPGRTRVIKRPLALPHEGGLVFAGVSYVPPEDDKYSISDIGSNIALQAGPVYQGTDDARYVPLEGDPETADFSEFSFADRVELDGSLVMFSGSAALQLSSAGPKDDRFPVGVLQDFSKPYEAVKDVPDELERLCDDVKDL